MFVRDKHSSLLDPLVSYAKNEVLRISTIGQYSPHFVTYEWAKQGRGRVLNYTRVG
jgi:hypothetical protein